MRRMREGHMTALASLVTLTACSGGRLAASSRPRSTSRKQQKQATEVPGAIEGDLEPPRPGVLGQDACVRTHMMRVPVSRTLARLHTRKRNGPRSRSLARCVSFDD